MLGVDEPRPAPYRVDLAESYAAVRRSAVQRAALGLEWTGGIFRFYPIVTTHRARELLEHN